MALITNWKDRDLKVLIAWRFWLSRRRVWVGCFVFFLKLCFLLKALFRLASSIMLERCSYILSQCVVQIVVLKCTFQHLNWLSCRKDLSLYHFEPSHHQVGRRIQWIVRLRLCTLKLILNTGSLVNMKFLSAHTPCKESHGLFFSIHFKNQFVWWCLKSSQILWPVLRSYAEIRVGYMLSCVPSTLPLLDVWFFFQ